MLVRVACFGDAPRNARGIWLWTKQQAETLVAENTEGKTPALTHVVGSVEWQRRQHDRLRAAC